VRETAARTGERLDAESSLYAADLVRHRTAYLFALPRVAGRSVLDLGCGTGYGAAELAAGGGRVVALDRVPPAASARRSGCRFVRADLGAVPLADERFDLIVSFQVLEHLEDR
jgi:SAM-dependent methyltransferase